jgi:hypothetical protein
MKLTRREMITVLQQEYVQATGLKSSCTYLRMFDVPIGEPILIHVPVVRHMTAPGTLTLIENVRGWAIATDQFQTIHGQDCRLFRFLQPVIDSLTSVWLTDDPLD